MVGYMLQPMKHLVILLSLISPPRPPFETTDSKRLSSFQVSAIFVGPPPQKKTLSVWARSPLGPPGSRSLRVRGWGR